MYSTALINHRIAILEDDPTNRDRLSSLVKMSGGVAVPASPQAPALDNFGIYLKQEKISLVVCDHRLFERDYASYTGAAAVATSYRSGCGGVLVTAYEKQDVELSIREYRRWIPALLHATELKQSVLEAALLLADREVREKILTRERIPHRTIMTIRRFVKKGNEHIVKVVMSQWNALEEVGFPLRIVPPNIQAEVVPGSMLIAQVNVEATHSEDLFFDRFELPDPDVLKKSKTLFSNT